MGMKVTPRIKKMLKIPNLTAYKAKNLPPSLRRFGKKSAGWNVFNKETSKPRGR